MINKNFTLSTIKNGGLEEVFQRELETVIKNVGDLNTDAVKARKITISLELKPNSDRDDIKLSFTVKSTLAAFQKQEASIYIGAEDGSIVAMEHQKGVIKNQITLEETHKEDTPKEQKVISIN